MRKRERGRERAPLLFLFFFSRAFFFSGRRERVEFLFFLPTESTKGSFSCRCPIEILKKREKRAVREEREREREKRKKREREEKEEREREQRKEGKGTAKKERGQSRRRRRQFVAHFSFFFFSTPNSLSAFCLSLSFFLRRAFFLPPRSHANSLSLSLHTSTRTKREKESPHAQAQQASIFNTFVVVVETRRAANFNSAFFRPLARPLSLCAATFLSLYEEHLNLALL